MRFRSRTSSAMPSLSSSIGRVFGLVMVLLLAAPPAARAVSSPRSGKWSTSSYGADGPWNAVEVVVGGNQRINLFVGHEFASYLITTDYCTGNSSFACSAGAYNVAASQTNTGTQAGILFQPPASHFMAGLEARGATTSLWLDSVDIQAGAIVPNVSLALVRTQMNAYPGGYYPSSAGCLGVGGAGDTPGTGAINQTFSRSSTEPPINASLVPGYFFERTLAPSNSYSMHIGSAGIPRMQGSLLYGGYDRSRVVGDVLSVDHPGPFTLKDIAISVVKGTSPFSNFTNKPGLLAANNATLSSGLRITIDGCSPYLSLPRSTCDAIAANLPVTYNDNLGLYLWNVTDPRYNQIVTSPTVLAFTFLGATNTQTVTVRVPFSHLNLTLTTPLTDRPTAYFPCFTGSDQQYALGRAFLQDAFFGAHWNQKKIFLAQAPGPGIQLAPSIAEIPSNALNVQSGGNDWEASWDGFWTPLTTAQTGTNPGVGPGGLGSSPGPGGLDMAGQIGVGVGVSVLALLIGAGAYYLWRRRRRSRAALLHSSNTSAEAATPLQVQEPGHVSELYGQHRHPYYDQPKSATDYNHQNPYQRSELP